VSSGHIYVKILAIMNLFPFLPMFPHEITRKGWDGLDVLIISGDPYADHPAYGAAVIGRLLESRGYQVGIIAQPDWKKPDDFIRLGRPRLCACVACGNVDSMIVNYTANKRRRRNDNKSGYDGARPDRTAIVYTNRLRAAFKGLPVIVGGVEASMRRLAHYDYWDDGVRRSILIDAKADMIVYGMGDRQIVEIAERLNQGELISDMRDIRGTVIRVKENDIPQDTVMIPSFENVRNDPQAFNKAFQTSYDEMNASTGKPVVQRHGDQYVLALPPALPLLSEELDRTYALPFTRDAHPFYKKLGGIQGFETVRWSITAVRGCPGECGFCGLAMHQGRVVQSRSEQSIIEEAKGMVRHPAFKGTITDIGGPTANLYGADCRKWNSSGACKEKKCLMPSKCPSLKIPYKRTLALYQAVRNIPGVKHVFVSSGLRYDLLLDPAADDYLREVCRYHISGQMKVAPEHTEDHVLALMNKPSYSCYEAFAKKFKQINARLKDKRYLVNYFISAHPGCRLEDAYECAVKLLSQNIRPEQVQDFLPLPMTVSSCLYYTGIHPFTGQKVYIPKGHQDRSMQRAMVQSQNAENQPLIRRALKKLGQEDQVKVFHKRTQGRVYER
jgi:uncharacterized radical SAM protein YgiQ